MNDDVEIQHFDKFEVQSKIKFWNNYSQNGNEKKLWSYNKPLNYFIFSFNYKRKRKILPTRKS